MNRLTVEAFMEKALYDPNLGYYSVHIATVGSRGDFSTGAMIAPWLGRAIGRWLKSEMRSRKIDTVIEIGAGTGALAESVLQAMGWLGRWGIAYRIVDVSSPLQKQQKKRLKRFRQVAWRESVQEALKEANGRAILFSNELLDAFPCRRLEWTGNEWKETELLLGPDGGLQEKEGRGESVQDGSFTALGTWRKGPEPGQRVEIHPSMYRWFSEWGSEWKSGAMLNFDYGDTFPDLYHRRKSGTLRGYFRQIRMDGDEVFQRKGHQDITTDVNFSDIQQWGERFGWKNRELVTQREFLLRWCPEIETASGEAVPFLLDPIGMGNAFKGLLQEK